MKDITFILDQLFLLYGALALVTMFGCGWLWSIVKRPEKWSAWVEKENDFWVRKGLASAAFADRCKHREKGLPMKLLVGTIVLLGGGGLIFSGCLFLRIVLLPR